MGGASIWHWIVVGVIVMLLFGRGKVSELMGDVAKGIKAFKKGMADEDQAPTTTAQVPHAQVPPVQVAPPVVPPATATEPVRPIPPHGEPLTNVDRKVV
ncbi:twin-arginine translocase TatA/TatE family subunit [Methylobacterium nonmethylotrophicum]|uniref:Sec-independent protein translocase protein TatA n=1 Tax=Methylobacterium nonmethylotrophicum TaxID=1141884 RepID=A0A4Z0NYI3_9HYPH|nr:twin-arginine translocase TatA/TatE family subunit [Methylobacterium nonmethylotrophicum]TGE01925.1 twin-arginine translocase TatA/TatE family subunit [Methylobacterium nonmethylotrophicum]